MRVAGQQQREMVPFRQNNRVLLLKGQRRVLKSTADLNQSLCSQEGPQRQQRRLVWQGDATRKYVTVVEAKTEAVLFHEWRRPVVILNILVADARIQIRKMMKYLGVILDSQWSFKDHFEYVEANAARVMRVV